MSNQSSEPHCARCGEAVTGKFCTGCGSAARDATCASCGATARAGAHFCPDCGAAIAAGAPSSAATHSPRVNRIPTLVGGAALLVLAAFVAGMATGRRTAGAGTLDQTALAAQAETPLSAATAGTAPDISAMSPAERASRLFNRVMLLSEQGKVDSARFFAPMAIQAYEMLGPVDAHAQYDIGVISAAAGDVTRARAEADTILAARPTHLLGLVLAIRAADLASDTKAAAEFRRRLAAAAPTERTALKEYSEHSRDIDEALIKTTTATR